MWKLRIVLCAAIACLLSMARAGVVVRVWQSQDGLPGNVARSVVQSSDGYLWVATAEGVARFDGFEFELIEPAEDLRRFRLAFSRLFATSGGDVWASTFQGGLYRIRNQRLEKILGDLRRSHPPLVTQLIESPQGDIYFLRGGDTGRIAENGTVERFTAPPEIAALFAEDLAKRAAGGRLGSGYLRLTEPGGRTWSVGNDGGLTIAEEGKPDIPVRFPNRGYAFGVNEMLLDHEGNVWIASPLNGLARVRPARVGIPDFPGNDGSQAFAALMQDTSGVWWMAERAGGLVRLAPDGFSRMQLPSLRPVAAFFEDREARIWIASRGGSVFVFENGEFVPRFSKTQVPSKVRCITQDSTGVIWFGGSQGLAAFADGAVRQFGKKDGVGEIDVTVMRPFPGGGIVAGGTAGNVVVGGMRGLSEIKVPEAMDHQWISGILPVSAAEIWFSTLGGGLFLWNGNSWRGFGADEGIPDLRLTGVLGDGRGNLWMGSLSGIIRVERGELLQSKHPPHWLVLDHTDGLPSRECIGGFQPAIWRADDGRLWFPTGGGVVSVRPELVERSEIPPPVYLRSVRANGVIHPAETGPVTTGPGRSRLEFRFVGLNLSGPEKTTFRARLKGLDNTWREFGNQRVAAFEAVPPGTYNFEVLAVNGDGVPSRTPARIPVVVEPRFWETGWFYPLVAVIMLTVSTAIGWLGARRRMKVRIQLLKIRNAREAERSRIARDLHDDLGASLTEISILSSLAAEEAASTPFMDSLDQLSTKAKHAVGSLDEIVWAVNPREDTLRSLVDYLAAFAREFLDLARIQLRVEIDPEIPDFPLVASRRHGIFLAFREALNNIVKHSRAATVHLEIQVSDHLLEIRIADDGRGFEPDYATGGEGLGNLRTRMNDAGGEFHIETHPGEGTTVLLTLPLHAPAKPVS
jgi:signal transduction histidine kinase/ligand-binding sensor domain-containing protein